MTKLTQLMTRISASISRLKQGEASVEDKVLLSALFLAILLLFALVVTIRFWAVPALGIVFFAYLILDGRRSAASQGPVYNLYQSAADEMFAVFCEVYDRIDAMRPIDCQDILRNPDTADRNGMTFIQFRIAKRRRITYTAEDLRLFGKIVQSRIVARLKGNKVANIPGISFDGTVPIFVVDDVRDGVDSVHFDVLVADNAEKCAYVINSQFAAATTPPEPPDFDEDF